MEPSITAQLRQMRQHLQLNPENVNRVSISTLEYRILELEDIQEEQSKELTQLRLIISRLESKVSKL